MYIIKSSELNAILAGLRLLQTHGYSEEFAGENELLDTAEIDDLCEAINTSSFASEDAIGKIEIWKFVTDTNNGTECQLYTTEESAQEAYVNMVMSYDEVSKVLGTNPTYEEAFDAWSDAISDGGIIDALSLETEEIDAIILREQKDSYSVKMIDWKIAEGCEPECSGDAKPYNMEIKIGNQVFMDFSDETGRVSTAMIEIDKGVPTLHVYGEDEDAIMRIHCLPHKEFIVTPETGVLINNAESSRHSYNDTKSLIFSTVSN